VRILVAWKWRGETTSPSFAEVAAWKFHIFTDKHVFIHPIWVYKVINGDHINKLAVIKKENS